MEVKVTIVPRDRLRRIWSTIEPGIEVYRQKTPHYIEASEDILRFLESPDGDELVALTVDGEYGGFITFKVQELEKGEVWGTMAMIFLTAVAQEKKILSEVGVQMEALLKARGCNVMNYMTARKGFKRLAPELGFRPRIIEWMKEI